MAICGPDEGAATRRVAVRKGHYRVTVAQKVIDEMREEIGIWFQWLDIPLERSELLIVDDGLDAAQPLLETAKSLSGD